MADTIKFVEWLKRMDFVQFHLFCGMLWDADTKRFLKWEFWPGVRGNPGQADVAKAIQHAVILWLLKARQLGLSEIAGFYAFFVAVTEEKAEIIIISKKLSDAKYFLKRRILYKMQAAYALEYAPGKKFPWPAYEASSEKIIYGNESWIEAVSSDNEEVRSRSPRLVIFDEARAFSQQDAEELWSAILPVLEANAKAQAIVISTAKFGTWYNIETKAILAGQREGVDLMFLPDDTHPKRTTAWRAQQLKKWSSRTLFLREHPTEPAHCFISREGAVFPMFDPKPGGRHVNTVKLDWTLRYMIGYDHGRQHPAVLLFFLYDKYANHLYIFDEVFCREMELPEVGFEIRKRLAFYTREHRAPPPHTKIADRACFNKDGRRTVAKILRDLTGIQFKESIKPGIVDSIDDMAARLSNNLITIDPRCENTIRQIAELAWKNEPGESKKEVPVDVEDDSVDIIRYVCAEIHAGVKAAPERIPLKTQLEMKDLRRRARQATGIDMDINPHDWQSRF